MLRQIISKTVLIAYIACVIISGDDTEYRIHEAERYYKLFQDYCTIDELGEMDYYLFCGTQIHKRGSGAGVERKPSIICSDTKTIEEAKELYQRFRETLPLDDEKAERAEGDEDERTEVLYVSPDCEWIITTRWSNFQNIITTTLFVEKEKIREKVFDGIDEITPIIIIKDGEQYKEMDERHYKQLSEIVWVNYYDIVNTDLKRMSEEGNLVAITNDDFSLLTINRVEDGTEQWRYDLQAIHEKVEKIRNDVQEGDKILVTVCQFEGNEKEGWLVIQAGPSSFFRIAYPSGEVTYLGEYLYSLRFSPDGKYAAYTSVDYDNGVGMDPIEYEQTPPPGIYVKEIETGKTAYIYWDPSRNPEEDYLEYRDFLWIEKESFEEYMGDIAISGQDTEDAAMGNPCFPYQEHTFLKGHAQYYDDCGEFVEEIVDAEIIKVKEYQIL